MRKSPGNKIPIPAAQSILPARLQQGRPPSVVAQFRATKGHNSKRDKEDDDHFQSPRPAAKKAHISSTASNNPFAAPKKTDHKYMGEATVVIKSKENDSDDDFRDDKKTRSSTGISTSKDSQTFTLPKRKNRETIDTSTAEMESYIKENAKDKDKVKCPYCSEILFPLTDALEKALLVIQEKDKLYEQEQLSRFNEIEGTSALVQSLNVLEKRPVSDDARDAFCRLHKLELVLKPLGVKKNYPTSIDFDQLNVRVQRFDEELKQIIRNKIKSDFRKNAEDAYKALGTNKARSTSSLMNRFEMCLPGYYGPKGSSIILSILTKLYLESGYLAKNLKSLQLPLEFLQQVIVPEVGFRLIRQDLYKQSKSAVPMPGMNEKARLIMEESRDYGTAMFPIENQQIETEEDEHKTEAIIVNSDDSDSDSDNVVIIEQETISSDDDDDIL